MATPVVASMETLGPAMLHVPPVVSFVSVTVNVRHTIVGPPIGAGSGFTVRVALVVDVPQPFVVV